MLQTKTVTAIHLLPNAMAASEDFEAIFDRLAASELPAGGSK